MKKPVYKLLDEKGRILIPKEFRQMAELESGEMCIRDSGSSDAVLWKIRKIGMLDHKMLWFEGKNWSKK